VWTYRYDATTHQLTESLTPTVGGAALSTTFAYDASGNLVSSTDARNNTVTYGYDRNGNRTLEQDALGNTVTRTFSVSNQMRRRHVTVPPIRMVPERRAPPIRSPHAMCMTRTRARASSSAPKDA
jgi:YD repeat-containing protein